MASTIKLKFNEPILLREVVAVTVNTGVGSLFCPESFVDTRSQSGQVSLSSTANGSAVNFATAWNLDYKDKGGVDNMVAVVSSGTVTISVKDPTWTFDSASGGAVSEGKVTATINNETNVPSPISVNFDGFTAYATDPCTKAYANYTVSGGSGLYHVYLDGVQVSTAETSPLKFLMDRGKLYSLKILDTNGLEVVSKSSRPPRKIIPNDLTLEIANLGSGTTVTVNRQGISRWIEPYTYSLDGTNYKSENVFTGLAAGNYTLYVKDAFGCVATKEFVLDGETEVAETVFFLSEINALRFAKIENGKKNSRNTLSHNELNKLSYPFFHRYTANDPVVTQFKTNAAFINIYTLDTNGNTNTINYVQQTENIGKEAKSTASLFDFGGGLSGLFFGVVDMLDPLSGAVLETIDYGFSIPEWAGSVGDFITIDAIGQIKIHDIAYSDAHEAFVLVFNRSHSGAAVATTAYRRYNIQPYEVYEFQVDIALQPDLFNVVVEAGMSENQIEFQYVSEKVKQVVDSDKLYEIDYFDDMNKGGMVYTTGIRHKLRLPGMSGYVGEQMTEGYNGDSKYYVTNNQIYRSEQFIFPQLSPEMAHKLRLVVAHGHLIINNMVYYLAEEPEITPSVTHNLLTFSVVLKSGGELFLDSDYEIISGSTVDEALAGAIEASKGKSLLLWTKNNG